MDKEKIDQILGTISGVLTVLKTIADTPGVNLLPYAAVASTAIGALQMAVSAGRDITPYINAIAGTFGNGSKVPTVEEVQALDLKIAELEAKVQEPLPPAEEGEPD